MALFRHGKPDGAGRKKKIKQQNPPGFCDGSLGDFVHEVSLKRSHLIWTFTLTTASGFSDQLPSNQTFSLTVLACPALKP